MQLRRLRRLHAAATQSLNEFYRERCHGDRDEPAMATLQLKRQRDSAVFAVISFVINPLSRSTREERRGC